MVLLGMYVNKMFLPKKKPQGHNLYPRKCYFEINTKIYLPLTLTLDLEMYLEEILYSSTLINQFQQKCTEHLQHRTKTVTALGA